MICFTHIDFHYWCTDTNNTSVVEGDAVLISWMVVQIEPNFHPLIWNNQDPRLNTATSSCVELEKVLVDSDSRPSSDFWPSKLETSYIIMWINDKSIVNITHPYCYNLINGWYSKHLKQPTWIQYYKTVGWALKGLYWAWPLPVPHLGYMPL